ncbi:MAG: hypothetical protein ACFFDF_23300 [Candidatus Odinarchaeota archaeon]
MKVYNLTKAHIQRINDVSKTTLKVSLLDLRNLKDNPFLLIVQSTIENSIKVSIYPLKKDKIIKLIFSTFTFSNEIFDRITDVLQNFQVIHTSGVLLIEKQVYYECYLNLSLDEAKSMGLNGSLNKIKNIFTQIKIEEIELIKQN